MGEAMAAGLWMGLWPQDGREQVALMTVKLDTFQRYTDTTQPPCMPRKSTAAKGLPFQSMERVICRGLTPMWGL